MKPVLSLVRCYLMMAVLLFFSSFSEATEYPITISADRMAAAENSHFVTFSGNVDVKQGDVRIRSDEMVVYYSPEKNMPKQQKDVQQKQQVEKMVCTGNVEITRGEWLGTSDQMEYLEARRQIILSGNAKAWQGQNMVSGNKIVHYLDEGRSEVIAGKSSVDESGKKQGGRVQMTILQK